MLSVRQLLIIALVIGVLWVLARLRRHLRASGRSRPSAVARYSDTVRCPRCGVHVPRSLSADVAACTNSRCPLRVVS